MTRGDSLSQTEIDARLLAHRRKRFQAAQFQEASGRPAQSHAEDTLSTPGSASGSLEAIAIKFAERLRRVDAALQRLSLLDRQMAEVQDAISKLKQDRRVMPIAADGA